LEIINDVANSFFNSILVDINEDFYFCEAVYKITDISLFNDFNERAIRADKQLSLHHLDYNVFITLDQSEAVSYGQSPDCFSILDQLNDRLKFIEDDKNFIKIKVFKVRAHRETNSTHVFNFTNYISNPLQRPDIEFINFLKNFDIDSPVRFNVWEKIYEFQTPLLSFLNVSTQSDSTNFSCERKSIIDKRNKSCHFTNDYYYKFIPDDFYLENGCLYPQIKNKFNRLLVVFTLVFLSDYSEITNSDPVHLDYKFKGYRLVSYKTGLNSISTNNFEELYRIYEWVYSQGSFVDKIGLARNIISIHMTGNDVATLASGTLRSIQSGYDIYLKDNVKQYIEIKNKISELLISQADKASDITKNMFGSLKTSLWSIVTFFITVVLIKAVASKGSSGTVSGDILSITAVFVLFSFVYLWLSLREVKDEKDRLFSRYEIIKSRYKDLLNDDDLNKVIDTHELKTQDSTFIDTRKRQYRNIWIGFNILTIVTVGIMYWYGKKPQVSELPSPSISKSEVKIHFDDHGSVSHKIDHFATAVQNNDKNKTSEKKVP
jgi:hypothetical protein